MAMSTGVTITRIAVADHRSIEAEARQRNSQTPSQQGSFKEIGQGIQKRPSGPSVCFDKMTLIIRDYLSLKARDISSPK
jgi:hypothetical protein